ncbi:MAG: ribulose-phosphate 3-epimerase [Parcubacteria group bacterium Greene0714_7]|nr:MAG: ribulose-phosphate 3-epimerase [Parcubacteria group bacterium Greene0714_7]
MIEVIPSLPASTFKELDEKIGRVRGLVSTFQIDITDGIFVPNISWPMHPEDQEQFQRIVLGDETLPHWEDFDFELDMMVHNPENLLSDWIQAGICRALIHIETKHNFGACQVIAKDKIELGIALNVDTPISRIDEYIEHISVVQLMGIANLGKQGQPFDPRVLESIREVKKRYPNVIIEVDGAVNKDTASLLVSAGATRLAPGSFIFKSENPKEVINYLESLRV